MPLPDNYPLGLQEAVESIEKTVIAFKESLPYTAPEAIDLKITEQLLIPIVNTVVTLYEDVSSFMSDPSTKEKED